MIGNEDNRGKGIGTFAVTSIVDHAFFNLNLRKLQLEVFELEVLEYNQVAQKLYRKIGFVEEGRRCKAVFKDSQYVDELIMGLLRDDYLRAHSSG